MVFLEMAFIVIGAIGSIASMGLTINLARAKQTHFATICGVLTFLLVASLIGCATLVN